MGRTNTLGHLEKIKTNLESAKNLSEIALMSHTYKLFKRILEKRVQHKTEPVKRMTAWLQTMQGQYPYDHLILTENIKLMRVQHPIIHSHRRSEKRHSTRSQKDIYGINLRNIE